MPNGRALRRVPRLGASGVLVLVASQSAVAQARVVSAPPEPSLLNITRQWASASSLGDLRELRTTPDHVELRVWGGYGLTSQTQGVVLRRDDGRWSALLARVMRCEIQIPNAVGDTASRATIQQYTAEARRRCGIPLRDVGPGARIITTDSLFVVPLSVPESAVADAWTAAVKAGVRQLPPRVERSRVMDDAFTYVVELRQGDEYRASVIEHLEHPATRADQDVQDVYAAVNRLLTGDQIVKP